VRTPLPPEPLRPTRLVYLQSWEGFPSPNLQRSGLPTLFPACLNCSYCLLLSFSFFPGWISVCPGGYAALAQACLWGYRGTTKLTWSASSQAVWALPATGGPGGPPHFSIQREVEILCTGWRCGGVKVIPFLSDYAYKVCLQCLSSVSPRFHYRRVTFCFLPLATILESPQLLIFKY
jgi:hypothetical protein